MLSSVTITNNLHTVVWFQVFLSNTNNYMVSSDYSYLEPQHHIQLSIIPRHPILGRWYPSAVGTLSLF